MAMIKRRKCLAPIAAKPSLHLVTLLQALSRPRLLDLARRLGVDCSAKWQKRELAGAFHVAHQRRLDRRAIELLTLPELRTLARQSGIPWKGSSRAALAGEVLDADDSEADEHDMMDYPGYPEVIDDSDELQEWATAYCRAAKADGYSIDFTADDLPTTGRAEGTVRAVSAISMHYGGHEFLTWQRYRGPRTQGPWFVLEFGEPLEWQEAVIYVKQPWNIAFSDFFMASNQENISFTVRQRGRKGFPKAEQVDFARAILDGLRYDYSDDEFVLLCSHRPRELCVGIFPPWSCTDESDHAFTPGPDGICWR